MSRQERDALRAKHRLDPCSDAQCWDSGCKGEHGRCKECRTDYPCEVVKVLDDGDAQFKAIAEWLCKELGYPLDLATSTPVLEVLRGYIEDYWCGAENAGESTRIEMIKGVLYQVREVGGW